MSSHGDQAPDDQFSRLLAAYDEALAAGSPASSDETWSQVDPQLLVELRAAQNCLHRLERKWPRAQGTRRRVPDDDSLSHFLQDVPPSLGRFQLQRKLGQGGHGVVFLAFDTLLRRSVALKLPRPDALLTPAVRRRFLREAQACAALKHPNMIAVYDAGEAGPFCYIAEAYCEGPSLSAWLKQQTEPVHPRLAARIVRTLVDAVGHAHRSGIVHLDLKPGNVLLEPWSDGAIPDPNRQQDDFHFTLKLTDFGLARLGDAEPAQTDTATLVGTVPYMAPEQAAGRRQEIGPRTDLYALGVTLFELLTKRKPFEGETAADTLRRIVSEEPTPLRHLRPDVPADLEAICRKCLEKSPADRYATAAELSEDLERFLSGRPTRARPLGPARRAMKWVRRRPAIASLIAVCIGAAVSLAVGTRWHVAKLQSAASVANGLRDEANRQRETAFEREARVRRYLYAADMKQAYAAWNNSHVGETLELLLRHRPKPGEEDLRSFVWYYLWQLVHSERLTLRGHQTDVRCVAFSPDGKRLATASFDGTARLWDAVTGQELATFLKGHKEELNAVAFSPDGKTLATGGDDRVVRLWDAEGRQQRAALSGHTDDVNTVAFSPDGKTVASGGRDRVAKVWDVASGKEIATFAAHRGAVESLAFSPDGRTLATASGDNTAILWDLPAKRPRATLRGHLARGAGYPDVVYAVTFAHAGRIVATGAEDCTARLWDTESGREKITLRSPNEVARCLAFSPDDRRLASAFGNGDICFWDIATQQVVRILHGHAGGIWSLAYSSDGRHLATAGSDRLVKIWSAAAPQGATFVSGLSAKIDSLNLSADGKILAVSYSKSREQGPAPPELWQIGPTIARRPLELPDCRTVALSADGNWLAVRTGTENPSRTELYDRAALRSRAAIELPGPLRCVWSPDSRMLAAFSPNGDPRIRLLDAVDGRQRSLLQPRRDPTGVLTVAFGPDGTTLASSHLAGTLALWDLKGRRERAAVRAHPDTVLGLAFAGDGRAVATGGRDGLVKIWDAETLQQRGTLQGHQGPVRSVAFCSDGKTVASGSDDGTVRLWDATTWQELLVLKAHKQGVGHVAFSSDGRLLVTGGVSAEGTGEVAFWSAPSPRDAFGAP